MARDVCLVAHGVLYWITLEIEEEDLDWLDETLLELTEAPQYVDELMRCFDLPQRLIQDALGRLLEQHHLLLDVAEGKVRRTGIATRFRAARRREEVLSIWQDHATGLLLPWDQIKPWCRTDVPRGAGGPDVPLRGGPPARAVLEMSDAELLANLERYRRDTAWSERVSHRERVRREALRLTARQLDDGRVMPLEVGVPWILALRWQRLPAISADAAAAPAARPGLRTLLPRPWAHVVGRWADSAHQRIVALQRGQPPQPPEPEPPADAVREVLERSPRVDWQEVGWHAFEAQFGEVRRSAMAVVSDRFGLFGGAMPVLRQTVRGERHLLVPKRVRLGRDQEERARAAAVHVGRHPRTDQDFVLLDSRSLVFGACSTERRHILIVSWRRPLLAYVAWLAECGVGQGRDIGHHGEWDDTDHLVARLRAFEQSLSEHERLPAPGPVDRSETPLQGLLSRLAEERGAIEQELRARGPIPTTVLEPDELQEIMQDRDQPLRIIVRDPESPLVRTMPRDSPGLEAVIVLSLVRPAAPPGTRWMHEAGPCEIVLLGDIVAVGCWIDPSLQDLPPFLAFHAPDLAATLRAATDYAEVIPDLSEM